jgi:hypothetical protein
MVAEAAWLGGGHRDLWISGNVFIFPTHITPVGVWSPLPLINAGVLSELGSPAKLKQTAHCFCMCRHWERHTDIDLGECPGWRRGCKNSLVLNPAPFLKGLSHCLTYHWDQWQLHVLGEHCQQGCLKMSFRTLLIS